MNSKAVAALLTAILVVLCVIAFTLVSTQQQAQSSAEPTATIDYTAVGASLDRFYATQTAEAAE